MSRSFLDSASGQPLSPAARQATAAFATRSWADPDAAHYEGRAARQLLQAARETVASVIGIEASAVSFQRPGRDVARLAIDGLVGALVDPGPADARSPDAGPVVVTSAVERSDVLAAANNVSGAWGAELIAVDSLGAVNTKDFAAAVSPPLAGGGRVGVMQVGNVEIGTLQPLSEVLDIANSSDVPVAVDATGSLGLVDIPVGWAALFADAQTWAGPREISVLAIHPGVRWRFGHLGQIESKPPEHSDVAGAVAAAAALEEVCRDRHLESARLSKLVERIRTQVSSRVPNVEVLGDPVARLPNIVTFSCLYADGERLAAELDRLGFAVGSGSACASRTGLPSHVLQAIGSLTHGNIRISLPFGCTEQTVEEFLAVLPGAVELVRMEAGAPT